MPRKTLLLGFALTVLLSPAAVFAQNTTLQGVVRGETQTPVSGAFVVILSLDMTTVTNEYGQYRFIIPAERVTGQQVTMQASSIGYAQAEVTVTLRPGAITQNITVTEQAIGLDEVVVTGTAGNQQRRAQAAVVASIDAARITQVAPITSVANLLQSRSPGVIISNNSGTTGTSQDIRIRGIASMSGNNSPLVFIDGVRIDSGNRLGVSVQSASALNDIKVEEIESMEIVKGPAAATLYGADASAGVINIITKRGRAGSGFTQTFNMEYGEADPNFTPLRNFARCTAGAIANPTSFPACVGVAEGTVLSDSPLERENSFIDGRYRNLNYTLSGGGDTYTVFFSVGADDSDGTLPHNEYGHLSSRANFEFFARENLRIGLGFGLVRVNTSLPQNDNNIYGYLGGGLLGDPRTVGATAKNGWYAQRQTLAISSIEAKDATTRFQPRLEVQFSPFSWFSNRFMVGADMVRSEEIRFWAKNDEGWWDNAPQNAGQVSQDRDLDDRFTIDYLGNISRRLTDRLGVDLSFGAQAIARRADGVGVTGRGLVTNDVRSVNAAAELTGGSQSSSQDRDLGVLGQALFNWMDRVYVKAGVRRDQSDAFGIDSEPFYSPSVGVSYVISDEAFFQNATSFLPDGALSALRLRVAYGISGRQPSGGARSTFSPSTNQVSESGVAIGVRPGATGNPLIRAEKSKELEVGFDAGLLNDRLGIEFVYFHKNMVDQIDDIPVPASLGASGPDQNIGAMENKGIELSVDASVLTRQNVALALHGQLFTLSNKITDLGGVPESSTRKVGFPITGSWDYAIREIDLENNRVIVSDTLEMVGNSKLYPGWGGGVSATLTLFENLSFFSNFDFVGDNMVYDNTNQFRDRQFGQGESAVRGAAAFGTDADGNPTDEARRQYMSRFGPFITEEYIDEDGNPAGGRQLNRNSVAGAYLQDGSFVKLREVSANYRIPSSLVQRFTGARSASLGLSVRNLHTWTDFMGFDPESDQFLTVPQDRRWTLRFNFQF
jgi:TonB-linked SusC/RagA family outer membrane protein